MELKAPFSTSRQGRVGGVGWGGAGAGGVRKDTGACVNIVSCNQSKRRTDKGQAEDVLSAPRNGDDCSVLYSVNRALCWRPEQ